MNRQTEFTRNTPWCTCIFQSAHTNRISAADCGYCLLSGEQKIRLTGQNISFFQTVLHAFPEFCLDRISGFQKAIWFVDKK